MIFNMQNKNKYFKKTWSHYIHLIKKVFLILCISIFLTLPLSFKFKPKSDLLAMNLIAKNNLTTDSMLVCIPYNVNFAPLSEEYKLTKYPIIEDFYNKNIASNAFSGSFLVAKNGVVLFEKYTGYSNSKSKLPFKKETPTHVASISKVLTSAAIMRLVHFEKLNLDQTVQSILTDFPYEDITIRHLLSHRSGLLQYSRFSEFIKGWNPRKILSNQDILDLFIKHQFKKTFKTDSKFAYNNTNYALLALIIERKTEKNFLESMAELVFEPLEMQDTFIIDFIVQKDEVCQSYKSDGVNFGWDQFDAIVGDKNVYSTARDLLKFDLATYSDEFLPPYLKEEMLKGYSFETKGQNNYGLGIRMKEFDNGQKIHYHNGWWHGNTSSYVTLKKDTVTIIALSNRFSKKPYGVVKLSALFGDYPYLLN